MNNKRILVIALLAFIAFEAVCQVRGARRRHYRAFHEGTTLVVKHGKPMSNFNERMKEEMERFWTVTPYEFITFEEFQRIRTSDEYSFIILAEIQQRDIPHIFKFMNFVLGDEERHFNRMPDLGSVPLAYRDSEEETYLYKLGAFVRFMNNYAAESGGSDHLGLTRFLNVRDSRVKEYELWLLEDELAPQIRTVEEIQKYYPYPVKIVTREDIQEAIAQQRDDIAFLHKLGPARTVEEGGCWKFIITTEGEVLYSNDHQVQRLEPDALLISDLKRMAR